MKKALVLILALLLILPVFSSCAKKGDDTIKVGGTWAMTGTGKDGGEYQRQGAILAIETINAAGGVLGRQLELIEEDEMDNQQAAVNAANKLLSRGDIVAFYAGLTSTNNIAISPLVREKKIPHLAGGSSANVYRENNPYCWQVRMTDDDTARVMARAAVENLGMKNPAILHVTDTFGTGLAEEISAYLGELGIPVAGIFGFTNNELQKTPLITQVMASGCDGLIAVSHDNDSAGIMKEMAILGGGIPCVGSASYATNTALTLGADAAVGWYSACNYTVRVDTPKAKEFTAAFIERWGRDPQFGSATTYDAMFLIAEAIKNANSTDPVKINEALGNIKDFPGVLCPLTPNENRCFSTSMYLVEVKKLDDGSIVAEVLDTVYRPD